MYCHAYEGDVQICVSAARIVKEAGVNALVLYLTDRVAYNDDGLGSAVSGLCGGAAPIRPLRRRSACRCMAVKHSASQLWSLSLCAEVARVEAQLTRILFGDKTKFGTPAFWNIVSEELVDAEALNALCVF